MITKLGKQKLEEKIRDLQKELDRTYKERNEAAAEGDLKENSAYIFMGERAQVLTSQIEEAKSDLKQSKTISLPTQTKKVAYGHRVKVRFNNDNREMEVVLVGKNDAHLKPSWLSSESPLGIALLSKSVGDTVSVNDQPVTILEISIADL